MKAVHRFALSVLSTGLLAVGFAQTANKFDPMTINDPKPLSKKAAPAPDCVSECNFVGESE